jgi:hypothetical protein
MVYGRGRDTVNGAGCGGRQEAIVILRRQDQRRHGPCHFSVLRVLKQALFLPWTAIMLSTRPTRCLIRSQRVVTRSYTTFSTAVRLSSSASRQGRLARMVPRRSRSANLLALLGHYLILSLFNRHTSWPRALLRTSSAHHWGRVVSVLHPQFIFLYFNYRSLRSRQDPHLP